MPKMKKLLSVLLAMTMVLGTLAIAFTATAAPGDEYTVSLRYLEKNADGEWEETDYRVTPGQEVKAQVMIDANYSVGFLAGFFFMDKAVFTPTTPALQLTDSGGTIDNIPMYPGSPSAESGWFNLTGHARDPMVYRTFKNQLTLPAAKMLLTEEELADWYCMQFNFTYVSGVQAYSDYYFDGEVPAFEIGLKVPETATIGATGTLFADNRTIKTPTVPAGYWNLPVGTQGALCTAAAANQTTNGAVSATLPTRDSQTLFTVVSDVVEPEDVTISFDPGYEGAPAVEAITGAPGAAITGGLPTPADRENYTFAGWLPNLTEFPAESATLVAQWTPDGADYDALDALIVTADDIDADDMVDSAAFTDALAAAKALSRDLTFLDQSLVNAAYDALFAAIAYKGADYSALVAAKAAAAALVPAHYTAASYAAVTAAVTAADAVPADLTVLDQGTIDAAALAINNAIAALETAVYEATFFVNGVEFTADIAYGATVVAPQAALDAAAAVAGFTHTGWTPELGAMPAADASYTATFSRNSYNLKFILDGTVVYDESVAYEDEIAAPDITALIPANYYFTGWDATVPETMPANALTFTGTTAPITGVAYTVQTYKMGLDGEYGAAVEEVLYSNAGAEVSVPALEEPAGAFYVDSNKENVLSATVNANGSTTLVVYYARSQYEFSVQFSTGGPAQSVKIGDYYYGASVAEPAESLWLPEGYYNDGWDTIFPITMGAADAYAYASLEVLPADFAALNAAFAAFNGLDETDYTETSWNSANNLYNTLSARYANPYNFDYFDQDGIDADTAAFIAAVEDLDLVADYSNYEAALAAAADLDYDDEYYTADSLAALAAAVQAEVLYDQAKETYQGTVDAATAAILAAIDALELKAADFTEFDAALAAFDALDAANYTTASWADVKAFFDDEREYYDAETREAMSILDQDEIDGAAAALMLTLEDLVLVADYDAYNSAVAAAADLVAADYTTTSWAVLEAALATTVLLDQPADPYQATVDAAATAIEEAIAALDLVADYSAYEAILAEAAELVETDWTADSWAVLVAALATEVLYDQAADTYQDTIDAAVAAIRAAIDALVAPVAELDFTALNAAILAANALVAENYKDFSGVTAALALVPADYDEFETQEDVDAVTAAINAAIDALEFKDADYSAYDAILAEAAALNEAEWKEAGWADLQAALAAEVLADQNLFYQSTIDAAVAAIRAAIDNLKRVDAPESVVYKVDLPENNYNGTANYTFWVKGSHVKIQIVASTGATRTYDKYHSLVTVVSYDENDNVIPDPFDNDAPDVAYESWTINGVYLAEDDYKVFAKLAVGRNGAWEDIALALEFTLVYDEEEIVVPPEAVTSFTVDKAEYSFNDMATFTVVTDESVTKVKLVYPNGTSRTYDLNSGVRTVEDGVATWTLVSSVGITAGEIVCSLQYKTVAAANVWGSYANTATYTVKDPAEEIIESGIAQVIPVLGSDTNVTAPGAFQIAIVAIEEATKLRLVNTDSGGTLTYDKANSNVKIYDKAAALEELELDIPEGTVVWVINRTVGASALGTHSYRVDLKAAAPIWIQNVATFSVVVANEEAEG